MSKIYVTFNDKNIIDTVSTSPLLENGEVVTIELEVENEDEIFLEPYNFKYNNGVLEKVENLTLLKQLKNEELNQACANAISSGFEHEINGVKYHFSFDTEAQLNYQGAERLLSSGMVSSIDFTVFRDGKYERIAIGKDEMQSLTMAILKHKNDNISKYRDVLLPKVQAASTKEEIEEIKW